MPYTNLTDFCTAIANAIRTAEGSSGQINAQNFPSRISALSGNGEISDLGTKMYSFGAVSDVHMGYYDGNTDFTRAMNYYNGKDVDFVCCAGDIRSSTYSASDATELNIYKNIIDQYTFPVYVCTGNHDMACEENVWKQYTGCDRNFVITKDDDVFIFASLDIATFSSTSDEPYLSTLTWLQQQLSTYKGCRIFLFMHYPPTAYSGLASGQYYGFSQSSTEDDTLITLLNNTENVTMFHGHTHYSFECEQQLDIMNVYRFNHNKVSLIHIPSSAYCKDINGNNQTDKSQGYIVDVYTKGFVVSGVDFVAGQTLEDYTYMFAIDNKEIQNSIILSKASTTLQEGGNTDTFTVKLLTGGGTVNISSNNNYVTVSPSTLSFSDDNYSTPQIVTITSAQNIGNESSVSTIVTASATNMTSKTVSVNVVSQLVPCTGLSLSANSLSFSTLNDTATLIATLTPSSTTDSVVWSTSDGTVATVSNGVVTAIADGTATITATCGNQTATCNVVVSTSQTNEVPLTYNFGTKIDTSTGVETTGQVNYACSDFIDVSDNKTYHLVCNITGVKVCYYGENQAYISTGNELSSSYDDKLSFVSGTKYIKLRIQMTGVANDTTRQNVVRNSLTLTKS